MKNSLLIFLLIAGSLCQQVVAQQNFYSSVRIEFERTVSPLQFFKEQDEEWYNFMKASTPATVTSYFEFIGDTAFSLYHLIKEPVIPPGKRYDDIADNNSVYNNYRNRTTIVQKPVFEETFLIHDSLSHIKWKITNDTRTIAGFECRKAIGTLMDSITVFAFFTDEILINGGPEDIHGLPGMILGVGIPRVHTTWFATKVEVNGVHTNDIRPATKGKKMTREEMTRALMKVLNDWGTYGKKLALNFLI